MRRLPHAFKKGARVTQPQTRSHGASVKPTGTLQEDALAGAKSIVVRLNPGAGDRGSACLFVNYVQSKENSPVMLVNGVSVGLVSKVSPPPIYLLTVVLVISCPWDVR